MKRMRLFLSKKTADDATSELPTSQCPSVLNLQEHEVETFFEKIMDEMNLSEDQKVPLQNKAYQTKKKIVLQWLSQSSDKMGVRQISEAIQQISDVKQLLMQEKNNPGSVSQKLLDVLLSLQISLSTNPLSWVVTFGNDGLNVLLETFNYFMDNDRISRVDNEIKHAIIRCLKGFMGNKYGLDAMCDSADGLVTLCRAFDPSYKPMMVDAVKLAAAVCLLHNGLDKVLEAITVCHENKVLKEMNALPKEHSLVIMPIGPSRFDSIIQGFGENDALNLACLQLINVVCSTPDDLDFRLHLRNEFMRTGLKYRLENLKNSSNEQIQLQVRILFEHLEDDNDELMARYSCVKQELQIATDPNAVFNILKSSVAGTSYESIFLSILQHLLSIRNDEWAKPQYYKLIEECVSQIVLHRNGVDPDFSYHKRFQLDVDKIIDQLVDQAKVDESVQRVQESQKQLSEELMARQEAELKLKKKTIELTEIEKKLKEQEAKIAQLRAKVVDVVDAGSSSEHTYDDFDDDSSNSSKYLSFVTNFPRSAGDVIRLPVSSEVGLSTSNTSSLAPRANWLLIPKSASFNDDESDLDFSVTPFAKDLSNRAEEVSSSSRCSDDESTEFSRHQSMFENYSSLFLPPSSRGASLPPPPPPLRGVPSPQPAGRYLPQSPPPTRAPPPRSRSVHPRPPPPPSRVVPTPHSGDVCPLPLPPPSRVVPPPHSGDVYPSPPPPPSRGVPSPHSGHVYPTPPPPPHSGDVCLSPSPPPPPPPSRGVPSPRSGHVYPPPPPPPSGGVPPRQKPSLAMPRPHSKEVPPPPPLPRRSGRREHKKQASSLLPPSSQSFYNFASVSELSNSIASSISMRRKKGMRFNKSVYETDKSSSTLVISCAVLENLSAEIDALAADFDTKLLQLTSASFLMSHHSTHCVNDTNLSPLPFKMKDEKRLLFQSKMSLENPDMSSKNPKTLPPQRISLKNKELIQMNLPVSKLANQRKSFQPATLMKRLDWRELTVLNEDCFWLRADDNKFENQVLFTQLMNSFGQKECLDITSVDAAIEPQADLKVLDEKTSRNLTMFLTSLNVDFPTLKNWMIAFDDKLSKNFVSDLLEILPVQDVIDSIRKFENQFAVMSLPEQFLFSISEIPHVTSWLQLVKLLKEFDELVAEIKSPIVAATAAMQDILKSQKFNCFLELLLLIGNFMNSSYKSIHSLGFDITYLTKLKDTKNTENTQTMIMFLAKIIEEQNEKSFTEICGFVDDLKHFPNAVKVSEDDISKSLMLLEDKVRSIEIELQMFNFTVDSPDKSNKTLSDSTTKAFEEYNLLNEMFDNMLSLYEQIIKFYCIDPTLSMQDFFKTMNIFRTDYQAAVESNKVIERKQERIRLIGGDGAEKLGNPIHERLGIDIDSFKNDVMDRLFAAMATGEAFRKSGNRKADLKRKDKKNPTLERYDASSFLTSHDISDVLGRGSFGTVRRCYHDELNWVVVKCFGMTGTEQRIDKRVENAAKEAFVVTQLKHPNIVRVFGVTWWNTCFGIVMEEVNGGCLEDLLMSKVEIPWKTRLKILLELARALEHLHCAFTSKAYVHGDIKPQNILLTDDLVTKLVDFGSLNIAMASGASTATVHVSSTQHTPHYSAPEVLRNPASDRAPSADIYSFGLVSYEMITRQTVFEGSPFNLIICLIRDRGQKPNFEPIKKVEQSLNKEGSDNVIFNFLRKIMVKCWNTNPDLRPNVIKLCQELQDTATLENIYDEENMALSKEIAQTIIKRDLSNTIENKVSLNRFFYPFDKCFSQEHKSSTVHRYCGNDTEWKIELLIKSHKCTAVSARQTCHGTGRFCQKWGDNTNQLCYANDSSELPLISN